VPSVLLKSLVAGVKTFSLITAINLAKFVAFSVIVVTLPLEAFRTTPNFSSGPLPTCGGRLTLVRIWQAVARPPNPPTAAERRRPLSTPASCRVRAFSESTDDAR
jgi:hypothetical protein